MKSKERKRVPTEAEFEEALYVAMCSFLEERGVEATSENILSLRKRAKRDFIASRDENNRILGIVPLDFYLQSMASKIVYSPHVEERRETTS